MSRELYERIKTLEKQLNESHDSMSSYNVKYRELQDKIDKLNRKIFDAKGKLREVILTINEMLKKLDLEIHQINLGDLKKLDNKKVITLIHSALRLINFRL
ncbi:MAG: hypothetical protein ACFE8A_00030 [Candidatus Hodarchaeota archaeon]